jgi:hypothetical protein
VIFLTKPQEKRLVPYLVNRTNNLRTQLYDNFKAAIAS